MHILTATHHTLKGLILFLEQADDESFRKPLAILNGSSLGEHTRHILEFYQCLLSQYNQQCINYDRRQRNRFIQEEPDMAIQTIYKILDQLNNVDMNMPLTLLVAYDTQTDATDEIPTSMKREITYCLEHAIHHKALIKVGVIANFPHLALADDFGVAPSTIKYQQALCAQ